VTPVEAAALLGLGALVLYAVFGGADFGGGVWDLLASGPRAAQQRAAITAAIGPVWEANHVWIIYALVLMFTCFPPAFADVASGLYVPLLFALVGIVLRGAAFVFRNYADAPGVTRLWTAVFGAASLLAPFSFGVAAGGLATGTYAWSSLFALCVGVFAVAVCAQVAAVFILSEIGDAALRDDFRRRAIRATFAVWVLGAAPALAALRERSLLHGLFAHPAAYAAVAIALVAGLAVIVCVARHYDLVARAAVAVEATAILAGWFGAQAPALVPGRYTYVTAASSDAMIDAFLGATAAGLVVLVPSLLLLFHVFKRTPIAPPP
jgi:cytochrome d ubiquinol oxidase subunit II